MITWILNKRHEKILLYLSNKSTSSPEELLNVILPYCLGTFLDKTIVILSPLSPDTKFKLLDPADCLLNGSRIDIWCYPLHTEFKEAHLLLNQEETTRAKRYHFVRHQRRFTVARSVLRIILARYLQVAPTELVFTTNKYGKPQLTNDPSLHFNLSHSGEMAILAIGKNRPLGIDLEFFSARPYEGIGNTLFSPNENQALQQEKPCLKPLVFFHIWSQKEAFIKACGLGLSYPTQRFDVPILSTNSQPILDVLHNDLWQMIAFMPQAACSAALCYHPSITDIRYLKLKDLSSLC